MEPPVKTNETVDVATRLRDAVLAEMNKVVIGQDDVSELLIVGLLAGGHVLLEGVPGVAKTLMVRALAHTLDAEFKRVQFTPDLMPADVLGTRVFDMSTRTFNLIKGPVFADLLLADEVNRAPPKTQSSLLEAMQERTVTLDGERHALPPLFTVFATQNPIETEGTYPLPEAQLDRFLFKVHVGYPRFEDEDKILELAHRGLHDHDLDRAGLKAVLKPADVLSVRESLPSIEARDQVRNYVLRLVTATREAPEVRLGAGPRAAIHLLLCSKARAALHGRDFITPDDVRELAGPSLGHRLLLTADAEVDGVRSDDVLARVLDEVEVPR